MSSVNFFWFRRDLRLHDNAGLYHALKGDLPVQPVFIFDTIILNDLQDKQDARVTFIFEALQQIDLQLRQAGSSLLIKQGNPIEVWQTLLQENTVTAIYANEDYEPYALQRDESIANCCRRYGAELHLYKDHVIFSKNEILKSDGSPYTVFTPYSKTWKETLHSRGKPEDFFLKAYPSEKYFHNFIKKQQGPPFVLENIGFEPCGREFPAATVSQNLIRNYDKTRDFPGLTGTSRLGVHFRFGTISIRDKANKALILNKVFLNELIWRDFYAMILYHFPRVVGHAFKPAYDRIEWRQSEADLEKWFAGNTGYPLVDAGMRELNATGYMHNRVRMVAASFLTKHLLLDWRLGEAYFAAKLLDFDLASNNGGWQWAAGCGTDAAPYFRIFNPMAQQQKFDPDKKYIHKWVPEYGTPQYIKPIVEHSFARNRCLETYKNALRG